jgi:hypothetical protein
MKTMTPAAPPGWYPRDGVHWYWDGRHWARHTNAPLPSNGSSAGVLLDEDPVLRLPIQEPAASVPVIQPAASVPVIQPAASVPVIQPAASVPVIQLPAGDVWPWPAPNRPFDDAQEAPDQPAPDAVGVPDQATPDVEAVAAARADRRALQAEGAGLLAHGADGSAETPQLRQSMPSMPFAPSTSRRSQGEPIFLRWWFVTAVVVLAAAVLVLRTGGDHTVAFSDDPRPAASTAGPAVTPSAGSAVVGPKVARSSSGRGAVVGGWVVDAAMEFTVTRVERGVRSVGADFLSATPEGQFVLVHLAVQNDGAEPRTLARQALVLRDTSGRTFRPDAQASIYLGEAESFVDQIEPGGELSGTLAFDIPAGAVPAAIELHGAVGSPGVTVRLG